MQNDVVVGVAPPKVEEIDEPVAHHDAELLPDQHRRRSDFHLGPLLDGLLPRANHSASIGASYAARVLAPVDGRRSGPR